MGPGASLVAGNGSGCGSGWRARPVKKERFFRNSFNHFQSTQNDD
jgi:hypothetical protein